jgi:murein DD-endopeptidase MepM/ murein hydrolase activator NlpD
MGRRASQVVVAFAAACAVAAPAAAKPVGGLSHVRVQHVKAVRHLTRSALLDFSWPAEGTITTPFTPYHRGLDIGMLRSLDVRRPRAGDARRGDAVCPSVVVQGPCAGELVARGQLLGIAGCTGYCTGRHLHFEVRQNGVAVDPRHFLGG